MSAASEMQAKLNELMDRGLDLGAQIGNDMDAGSGGRVRVFERGRIYWHENTGAHEVHGGILQKYLDEGGPGANPGTDRRHFGYPISDETRTLDGLHPVSHFEFGDIIFLPGTSGGVTIHDAFFQEWKRKSSELGSLLYPITEPIPVAGGQAVYFERGCLWRGPATNNEIIAATFNPPLLGNPKLVRPEPGEIRNFMEVRWHGLPQDTLDLILRNRPALFSEIWNDRIVIRRVARSAAQRVVISLLTQDEDFQGGSPDRVNVILRFRLPTNGPIRPQDRAVYDGYAADDLVMLQSAISEASDGLVIVGMHAPPLNIAGSELAHYFRETEHPTVDGREIDAFLARHNGAGVANNWPRSGTKHFKTGQIEDLLDSGIARGDSQRFFELCTGAGGARPVDLVLCGHDHDRVEYRVTRNANNPGFRFFTDFYLSVPDAYYPSRKAGLQEKAHLRIRDSAAVNGNVRRVRDNRFDPPLRYNQLDVPPYANSLDSVLSMQATKSAWWISHRPLIVETAALGPLDRSQRVVGSTRPSVSFMGFRYFGVRSGVIHNAVYIALRELRENGFVMPWESAGSAPDPGPIDPKP